MAIPKNLTWNDRLALIKEFNPTDEKILSVFKVSERELKVARHLESIGTFIPAKNIDLEAYAPAFVSHFSNLKKKHIMNDTVTSIKRPAETATKKVLKRGRKGSNITSAFFAVPTTPTDANAFASNHKVSIAVLRQSKRFDTHASKGHIKVKKDKATGTLMIWRENM